MTQFSNDSLVVNTQSVSQADCETASKLLEVLASASTNSTSFAGALSACRADEITLAPTVMDVISKVLTHLVEGNTLVIDTLPDTLTALQAAELLGISTNYVIDLTKSNVLKHSKTRKRLSIKTEDVLALKRDLNSRRETALEKLASVDGQFI